MISQYIKNAWFVHLTTGERRTLHSWGDKHVKLGLGYKMPALRQITREEFDREWELSDPKPYDA